MKINPFVRHAMYDSFEGKWLVSRSMWDYELIFIAEGEMNIQVGDETYVAKEGDFVFLRPKVPHTLSHSEGRLSQPHVHFDLVEDDLSPSIYVSLKHENEMTEEEKIWFRHDDLKRLGFDFPTVVHLYNNLEINEDTINIYVEGAEYEII